MAKKPKYALYMEMTKDIRGAQLILTPPLTNLATETDIKTKVFARKISAVHPRRSWNTYNTRYHYQPEKSSYTDLTIEATAPVLNNVNEILIGYVASGWKMTSEPIVVEMTYDDERDVEEGKAPAALVRRISRARAEAGYPSTVWKSEEPVLPPAPTVTYEPILPIVLEHEESVPELTLDELRDLLSEYRRENPEPETLTWKSPDAS
jgi:hypothetical protein